MSESLNISGSSYAPMASTGLVIKCMEVNTASGRLNYLCSSIIRSPLLSTFSRSCFVDIMKALNMPWSTCVEVYHFDFVPKNYGHCFGHQIDVKSTSPR